MKVKHQLIVLFALPYKITDEKTGQINEGLQLIVHPSGDLSPTEENNGYAVVKGSRPMKVNLPFTETKNIVNVPALYEADLKMQAKGDLKGSISFSNMKYLSDIKLEQITKTEEQKELPKPVK